MENDRRKNLNGNQAKRLGKTNPKNNKKRLENGLKNVNSKQAEPKASVPRPDSRTSVSDKNTGAELPEAYENMVIHYVDDVGKSMEAKGDAKASTMSGKQNNGEVLCDSSSDLEKESVQEKEISDSEIPHKYSGPSTHGQTTSVSTKLSSDGNSACVDVPLKPSSESSDGIDDKPVEEVKEVDVLDQTSNGTQSVGSDDERIDAEENGEHKDESALEHKIEEMETRIEKLEEELREVAALEISLYSVIPEHGSSAHKVHTPARRLSRLYIHACKHWTLDKRATIAKNTVSGLILIARSCSNDVPRLTFWLSNIIVLRGIISQAFGSSRNSNPFTRFAESNGFSKSSEGKFASANLKWKGGAAKQRNGFMPVVDDWQETGTLIGALEKVESWIFSRIVESVWWQALTPYMQTPADDSSTNKSNSKLLGPALGDQQQGSFAIDLWRSAFQDAFHRLCPVRAGGHDCGCLPVLARMVMKQCVARLDVAMFNAILRESAHEIPTDPISDPIIDSKVLPIPAGDLSFGSGAQLKNSVGNWSRWLNDALGMDGDDAAEEEGQEGEDEYKQRGEREDQSFRLLNELSDLLMLPKDMLMDRSIRKEVCPSVTLTLVKRILCNFTPDEFCPDPVPGAVLEALNAESIVERRLSGETARSFPYAAALVLYSPPSSADMAEKVAEAGERSPLARNVSMVQRKGYTSDEELEDLDSPLTTFISKPDLPPVIPNGNGNGKHMENPVRAPTNARYELLREVWSV